MTIFFRYSLNFRGAVLLLACTTLDRCVLLLLLLSAAVEKKKNYTRKILLFFSVMKSKKNRRRINAGKKWSRDAIAVCALAMAFYLQQHTKRNVFFLLRTTATEYHCVARQSSVVLCHCWHFYIKCLYSSVVCSGWKCEKRLLWWY